MFYFNYHHDIALSMHFNYSVDSNEGNFKVELLNEDPSVDLVEFNTSFLSEDLTCNLQQGKPRSI